MSDCYDHQDYQGQGARPRVAPFSKTAILLRPYSITDGDDGEDGSLHAVGSLLTEISIPGAETKVWQPVEGPLEFITVRPFHLAEVPEKCVPYLLAVKDLKKRIRFFMNKVRLDDVVNLEVGHTVVITDKPALEGAKGFLRYKGELKSQKGKWFGVELSPELAGEGSTDGTFKNVSYFTCEEDCGVFLRPTQIRPENPKLNPNLEIDDRVVLMVDDGEFERAAVKWIGFLEEDARQELDDLKVGVQFDKPVGSGTGRYKSRQLFWTKKKHASIVHILGLLKEAEFFPPGVASQEHNQEEPMTPESSTAPVFSRSDDREPPKMDPSVLPLAYDVSPRSSYTDWSKMLEDPTVYAAAAASSGGRTESDSHSGGHGTDTYRHKLATAKLKQEALISRDSGPGVSEETTWNKDSGKPDLSQEKVGQFAVPLTRPSYKPHKLVVGSRVEIFDDPEYGTIRWIGNLPHKKKEIAGVEMDKPNPASYTSGSFGGKHYFNCKPNTAFFINIEKLKRSREQLLLSAGNATVEVEVCEEAKAGTVTGVYKGIQGELNSCYMDTILFALFRFSSILDTILEPVSGEPSDCSKVKGLLSDIVNTLRQDSFVKREVVLPFRRKFASLFPDEGFRSKQRDPEEFLTCLLNDLLKVPPFIILDNGLDTHIYQLLATKSDNIATPTTQQLLHASLLDFNLKLQRPPSLLMLLVPRSGKAYQMYDQIVPSSQLDITDLVKDQPRSCWICSKDASIECAGCYEPQYNSLEMITFCEPCFKDQHQRPKCRDHSFKNISVIPREGEEKKRLLLELVAVICIETSHYVAFTKGQFQEKTSWMFFDSMADRKGWGEDTHNVPKVTACPEVDAWFSRSDPDSGLSKEYTLEENVKRMVTDAYLCLYQTPGKLLPVLQNLN